MVLNEAGPYKMFSRLRARNGGVNYADGASATLPPNGVLSCFYCLSVWVSGIALLLPSVLCVPFALSTLAIGVECIMDRLRG